MLSNIKFAFTKIHLILIVFLLLTFIPSLSVADEIEDIGVDIAIVKAAVVNLRKEPSIYTPIVVKLKKDDFLVLLDRKPTTEKQPTYDELIELGGKDVTEEYKKMPLDKLKSLKIVDPYESDWYNVIDINSGEEGWIFGGLVDIYYTKNTTKANIFSAEKIASITKPEVVIKNDSKRNLKLKVGSNVFVIDKDSEKTILMDTGSFDYYASAPGVIPALGVQTFEKGYRYSWRFWIETKVGFGFGKRGRRYKRR